MEKIDINANMEKIDINAKQETRIKPECTVYINM